MPDRQRRPAAPLREISNRQRYPYSVNYYKGHLGRVRVTFGEGKAFVGLPKKNGSYRTVATLPWTSARGDQQELNAVIANHCGEDFILDDS